MKKILLASTVLLLGATVASAQNMALEPQRFGDNWSVGVEGGMTTPLPESHVRGIFGAHIQKQISPAFGVGVEGSWMVNTQKSSNAVDEQYVGAYGAVNLFNLFGGYKMNKCPFNIELQAGAGWGHDYFPKSERQDWNYFATRVGVNFNFRVSNRVTLSVRPSFQWDMSDADDDGAPHMSSAFYRKADGRFNLQAGVAVRLGRDFQWVPAYDADEVAALNAQINDLRAANLACEATAADLLAQNAALAAQLDACLNQPKQVVKEVKTDLSTVRYVNFQIGKTNITADQMPNVAAVASYLKNHPKSTVVIDGYASKDGPEAVNIRLANERAASVKNTLVNKYGISADRIKAQGKGIGEMFDEESWNRVAICTVDAD